MQRNTTNKVPWSPQEDENLRNAVNLYQGKNWKKIAECVEGRTDVQCLHRWQKKLNPNLIRQPWTKEEDQKLVDLVNQHGSKNWSSIASQIPGRIGKQCRERWHNYLNTENKNAWTEEEDKKLIELQKQMGNRWSAISQSIPGRTDNALKNRWNSVLRKRRHDDDNDDNDDDDDDLGNDDDDDYDDNNNNTEDTKYPAKVNFESALDFLDTVKSQFSAQPRVYNEFLDIMKSFKSREMDTEEVIAKVKELFKGHDNLILGFSLFLPPGYQIDVDDKPTPPPQNIASDTKPTSLNRKLPEFDSAREYVKKVKARFQNQPQVYKSFLEILHQYHTEKHTISGVHHEVVTLFAGHHDLISEFDQFLPDSSREDTPSLSSPSPSTSTTTTTSPSPPDTSRRTKGRPARSPKPQKTDQIENGLATLSLSPQENVSSSGGRNQQPLSPLSSALSDTELNKLRQDLKIMEQKYNDEVAKNKILEERVIQLEAMMNAGFQKF
eukprot:TRINITY_DN4992_c2_g1_i1.p1 TRINITY_DN4992_c2_g1~~TRINITY_DN4992_c2_g1_i1.p1  ORF type:complete len:494 (-),score=115.30 TRINITY_DN4992_c2_g1_i1:8-1489(-)